MINNMIVKKLEVVYISRIRRGYGDAMWKMRNAIRNSYSGREREIT